MTFFIVLGVFALIGAVRGVARELGVTLMLLIALMVLLLLDTYLQDEITAFLAFLTPNVATQKSIQAIAYSLWMILIAFISYEGRTISFSSVPLVSEFLKSSGAPGGNVAGGATGLLNGYLIGGTIWYYLACADWPLLPVSAPFSDLYYVISAILPPVIFKWWYVLILIVLLMIIKIWK